ncbi:MAG: hypothetical protein ATN35_10435 [Epulopiscium sp. Nele67-Bin004]|nr:MAG: hypothetical protein ATN35_10435 [Epulopiscium sp. Nele67-Bin004]
MAIVGYTVDEGRDFKNNDSEVIAMGRSLLYEFNRIGKEYDWNNRQELDISFGDKLEIYVGEFDWEKGNAVTESWENLNNSDMACVIIFCIFNFDWAYIWIFSS